MNRLDFEELNDAYLSVKKQKIVIGASNQLTTKSTIITEKKTAVTINDKLRLNDIQDAYNQMRFEKSNMVDGVYESPIIESRITENIKRPIIDQQVFRAEDDILSAYNQVRIDEGLLSAIGSGVAAAGKGLAAAGSTLMKGISGIMAGIAQMFKNMFAAKTGGAQKTEAGGGAGGTALPSADDVVKKDGTKLTENEKVRYNKFKEDYEKSLSEFVASIGAVAATMKKDLGVGRKYDFIPTSSFNTYETVLASEGMKKISQKFLVDVSIFGMENVDTTETLHKCIIDTCKQTDGKIFANEESIYTIMSSCVDGKFLTGESNTGLCASLILYMGSKFFSKEVEAFAKSTILTSALPITKFVIDPTEYNVEETVPYVMLDLTKIGPLMIEGKAPSEFLDLKALAFCNGILSTLKDAKITPTKRILNKLITALNKGNAFLTIDAESKPGRGKVDPTKFVAQITPEMFKDAAKMDTPEKKMGTYNTTILASMIWAMATSDISVLKKVDVSCKKVIELIENYNGVSTEGVNISLETSDETDKNVEVKLETPEDIDKVLKQITDLPADDISKDDAEIYDSIKNILDKKKIAIVMKDGEEKTKALAEVTTLEKEFKDKNKKDFIEWLKEKLKAKVEEKPKATETGDVTPIAKLTPEAADDLSKKLTDELPDIDAGVATAEADATKAAESLKSAKDLKGKGGTDAERKKAEEALAAAEEAVKKTEAAKVSAIKDKEMVTAAIDIFNRKSELEKTGKNDTSNIKTHKAKLKTLTDDFEKNFGMTFDQWQAANAGISTADQAKSAKTEAEKKVAAVDNEAIRIDNAENVGAAKARLADIIAKGEAEEKAKEEAIKKAEAELKVSQDKAKAAKNEAEKAAAEKATKAKDDEIKKLKDEMQKLKDEAEKAKAVKVIVDLADTKTKAEDAGKDKEAGAAGGEILKKEQELKDKLGTSAEEFLNKPEEEKPEDKKEEPEKDQAAEDVSGDIEDGDGEKADDIVKNPSAGGKYISKRKL